MIEHTDVEWGERHLTAAVCALHRFRPQVGTALRWGERLAGVLGEGRRLLAAGNGGSAAHAQHLTAQLVGRHHDERRALSALALHADTSSLTAITNDYGPHEAFARQVEAHGRAGDVLIALSTSGDSANLLAAADRAHELGLVVWALTGPAPNPLATTADEAITVNAQRPATVQEVHQVAVHLICAAVDQALGTPRTTSVGRSSTAFGPRTLREVSA